MSVKVWAVLTWKPELWLNLFGGKQFDRPPNTEPVSQFCFLSISFDMLQTFITIQFFYESLLKVSQTSAP
jgi:hypothetical protein